jgi:hypothetical protein
MHYALQAVPDALPMPRLIHAGFTIAQRVEVSATVTDPARGTIDRNQRFQGRMIIALETVYVI